MKKLLFIILLFTGYISAQQVYPLIYDTTSGGVYNVNYIKQLGTKNDATHHRMPVDVGGATINATLTGMSNAANQKLLYSLDSLIRIQTDSIAARFTRQLTAMTTLNTNTKKLADSIVTRIHANSSTNPFYDNITNFPANPATSANQLLVAHIDSLIKIQTDTIAARFTRQLTAMTTLNAKSFATTIKQDSILNVLKLQLARLQYQAGLKTNTDSLVNRISRSILNGLATSKNQTTIFSKDSLMTIYLKALQDSIINRIHMNSLTLPLFTSGTGQPPPTRDSLSGVTPKVIDVRYTNGYYPTKTNLTFSNLTGTIDTIRIKTWCVAKNDSSYYNVGWKDRSSGVAAVGTPDANEPDNSLIIIPANASRTFESDGYGKVGVIRIMWKTTAGKTSTKLYLSWTRIN
jgi:hypothetical protein